jgi:hypothetical protein
VDFSSAYSASQSSVVTCPGFNTLELYATFLASRFELRWQIGLATPDMFGTSGKWQENDPLHPEGNIINVWFRNSSYRCASSLSPQYENVHDET